MAIFIALKKFRLFMLYWVAIADSIALSFYLYSPNLVEYSWIINIVCFGRTTLPASVETFLVGPNRINLVVLPSFF